jgi:ribonucleotide reductase alpha subunit
MQFSQSKLESTIGSLLESINLPHIKHSIISMISPRMPYIEGESTTRAIVENNLINALPKRLATRYVTYKANRKWTKGFSSLLELANALDVTIPTTFNANLDNYPKYRELMIFLNTYAYIPSIQQIKVIFKYAEINQLLLSEFKKWDPIDLRMIEIFSYEGLELTHRRYLITFEDYSLETIPDFIKRVYGYVSDTFEFDYVFSTPIMRGIEISKLAACLTINIRDSIDGILNGFGEMTKGSRNGAGLGVHLGHIRPNGEPIGPEHLCLKSRGPEGVRRLLRSVVEFMQQPNRKSAVTWFIPGCHPCANEMMDARYRIPGTNQMGTYEHLAIVLTDDILEAYENGTYFDLRWSEDYLDNKKYVGGKKYGRQSAKLFMEKVASLILNTGEPFILFHGNVNKTPDDMAPIITGNLCMEFLVPNVNKYENSYCFLGSVVLPAHIDDDGNINFDKLAATTLKVASHLNKLADTYPFQTNKLRPFGVGVAGLWDAYFKCSSINDRLEFNRVIFSFMSKVLKENFPDKYFNFMIAPTSSVSRVANVLPGVDPPWDVCEETITGDGRFVKPNPYADNPKFFVWEDLTLDEQLELAAIREQYAQGASNTFLLPEKEQNIQSIINLIVKAHKLGIRSIYYIRQKRKIGREDLDTSICDSGACEV